MAPWIALALVGLLLGATNIRAVGGESFNYDLSGTDWPGLCQTGKKQSPINIVTSAVKHADGPSLLKVKHPLSREITVTNEEHAAAVSPQAGKRYYLTLPSGLHKLDHSDLQVRQALLPHSPLGAAQARPLRPAGKRYYLTLPSGLHKLDHSDLQVPSIHLVDGVQAPMEAKWAHGIHLVDGVQAPMEAKWAHGVPSIHLVDGVQAPMEARGAHREGLLRCTHIHLVDGVQAPMEAKFAYVNVANSTRKSVFSVFLKLHPRDKDNCPTHHFDCWLNDIPAAVNGTAKIAAKTNFLELLSFEAPFWLNDIPSAVNGTAKVAAQTNFMELLAFDLYSLPPPFSPLATYMNFLSRTNSGDRTNNRLPQPLNARTVSVFRAN
ncbi:unnamed protein product [Closterium sp. Naga37s-1]|nr:unnamed protein product [Closterium sp. Naga37s-1]